MGGSDGLDNGKTKTESLRMIVPVATNSPERLQDPVDLGRRNRITRISHRRGRA
jgi:hypothetical protein